MLDLLRDAEVAVETYFNQRYELQAIVLAVFAGVNSIRIVAYVPQMVKAARDSNGASAISYMTWGLFLVSHVATILYAIVCVADLIMAAIFFGNALACLGIILIAMRNRRQFHLRNAQTL